MGTDEGSMYEGCFIIDSGKRSKNIHGHPFGYYDVFQIRSSEVLTGSDGQVFEALSIIVKHDQKERFSQRRPNWREVDWIRAQFFDPKERVDIVTLPAADGLTDHRLLWMFRPADGWNQWPEMFREDFTVIERGDGTREAVAGAGGNVAQMVRNRRAESADRERNKLESDRARALDDCRRILQTADFVAAPSFIREDPSSTERQREGNFHIGASSMARLKSILGIE